MSISDPGAAETPQFETVDQLLAAARTSLCRVTAEQAAAAISQGSRLVDIRPVWQRARDGEIPGALIVERNHLEWRLDPASEARLELAAPGQHWIIVCSESYTSSLAAASLRSLGVDATDLIGGLHSWQAAGYPVTAGPTRVERICGSEPPLPPADFGGPAPA